MEGYSSNKLKILYLKEILERETDEDNRLTVNDLIVRLKDRGISAERKSIYDDIEALKNYGVDVECIKRKSNEYYIANRFFQRPELKLLVDAVLSSRFVTRSKSNELIEKIESLTSVYQAKYLHGQTFINNRPKSLNNQVYYIIDSLYEAIADKKKVSFKYFDISVLKTKEYRKNGEPYVVSPLALCWDDEKYYLVAYHEKYGDLSNFRVDKMENVNITDMRNHERCWEYELDLARYIKKIFNMYSGEDVSVILKFKNNLVSAVFDKFGVDIPVNRTEEDSFEITADVSVSPAFFSWLFLFGDEVEIISPLSLREQYHKKLRKILNI